MEKHIMGENGISYTLGEDGLYYQTCLPEETEYPIGKYGMLRKTNVFKGASERTISGAGAC